MAIGDIIYIIVAILFSYMTFVIIRNNFLSKFDEKGRRKDLVDQYEEDYGQADQIEDQIEKPKED